MTELLKKSWQDSQVPLAPLQVTIEVQQEYVAPDVTILNDVS